MLIFVLAMACAPPPYTPPETGEVDTGPSIEITWPLPETPVVGCVVTTVNIRNFEVVNPSSTDGTPTEGQGHWHVLHPAGPNAYDVCWKPYCVAHFEGLDTPVNDFLTAQLVGNDHQAVFDEDNNPFLVQVPASFSGGDCPEDQGSEPYDTGNDETGMNGG